MGVVVEVCAHFTCHSGVQWNSKPLDTPLPEIGSTAGTQERKGEEKRKVKVQPNENTVCLWDTFVWCC